MKEVIERCNWLVNKCEDKAITPDVKDDISYLLEEIERLQAELEKQTIDYGLEIEDLKEQVKYQDLWREEYLSRIDKAIEYMNNTYEINDLKELFKHYDNVEAILKGSDKE